MRQDFHTALKIEIIGNASSAGVNFLIAKLQHSKEDVSFSIHAEPTSHKMAGIQTTDFLSYLGFQRQNCAFITRGQCYTRWISKDFPLAKFSGDFGNAFGKIENAEKHLNYCGFLLERPEGWGYFNGKESYRSNVGRKHQGYGDGHNSPISKLMKQEEDEFFYFTMSWIEGQRDKGWTFHYRPKHPPLQREITSALDFLGLSRFSECPFYDFEECRWVFFPHEQREDTFSGGNAQFVHGYFDSHSEHFSSAIKDIVVAHSLLQAYGFSFLNIKIPTEPAAQKPTLKVEKTTKIEEISQNHKIFPDNDFDVAISFAGSDRIFAEQLAKIVRDAGFNVFYDNFYPEHLWGKDLPVIFDDIYRKQSKYCVIFISKEYCERMWTNYERQSAQARAIEERTEYILPIRLDDSELPGLAPTIGYLSIQDLSIEEISKLLISKLSSA